ncbi:hypothetical protein ID866_6637 [Astraeus odoratus]|nr:hypothetical protein ID866_6637 [Astraeus odoratus]
MHSKPHSLWQGRVQIDVSYVSETISDRSVCALFLLLSAGLCVAMPDLTAVPEKYHDFIVPAIRKLFIDIPSVSKLSSRAGILQSSLDDASREIRVLEGRYIEYEEKLSRHEEQEMHMQMEMDYLQNENEKLKRGYDSLMAEYLQSHSCCPSSTATASGHTDCDISTRLDPVDSNILITLLVNLRPKRALPKGKVQRKARQSEGHDVDPIPQYVKKQRVGRRSDASFTGQTMCGEEGAEHLTLRGDAT